MPEFIIAKLALLPFPQFFMERLFFFKRYIIMHLLTHQKFVNLIVELLYSNTIFFIQ